MPKNQETLPKTRKATKKSKSDVVDPDVPTPKIPRNMLHSTTFQKGTLLFKLNDKI